jgi:hypothetical protein
MSTTVSYNGYSHTGIASAIYTIQDEQSEKGTLLTRTYRAVIKGTFIAGSEGDSLLTKCSQLNEAYSVNTGTLTISSNGTMLSLNPANSESKKLKIESISYPNSSQQTELATTRDYEVVVSMTKVLITDGTWVFSETYSASWDDKLTASITGVFYNPTTALSNFLSVYKTHFTEFSDKTKWTYDAEQSSYTPNATDTRVNFTLHWHQHYVASPTNCQMVAFVKSVSRASNTQQILNVTFTLKGTSADIDTYLNTKLADYMADYKWIKEDKNRDDTQNTTTVTWQFLVANTDNPIISQTETITIQQPFLPQVFIPIYGGDPPVRQDGVLQTGKATQSGQIVSTEFPVEPELFFLNAEYFLSGPKQITRELPEYDLSGTHKIIYKLSYTYNYEFNNRINNTLEFPESYK